MSPRFAQLVEQRRIAGATTRDLLKQIIVEEEQPLSVAEVCFRYNALTGKKLDNQRTNRWLNQLVAAKALSTRVETEAERIVRSGGVEVRGQLARLFSAKAQVPRRTEALPDIVLGDGNATSESQYRASKRWLKRVEAKNGKVPGAYVLTEVERVVNERNELRARVEQLEAILNQARSVIKA